ncbi:MAG: hypothetical protein JO187_10405 [Acidobacteria bacterium]|nr:hypothetical protein [Acidobacteriota bacterium]
MGSGLSVSVVANFLLLGGLVLYGFMLFAEYHAKGRWAKNVTALLAGLGMLFLALAVALTPGNAEVIRRIAQTNASKVLLGISSGFLVAGIAAFGIITYSKPLRLRYERKIETDLNSQLPNIE